MTKNKGRRHYYKDIHMLSEEEQERILGCILTAYDRRGHMLLCALYALYYYHCLPFRKKLDELTKDMGIELIAAYIDQPSLDSFIPLAKLSNLKLQNCPNIKSINQPVFDNLRDVSIIQCQEIKDISGLINVEKVRLIKCKNISNVNVLTNVKILIIVKCHKIVTVTNLKKLTSLYIHIRYLESNLKVYGLCSLKKLAIINVNPGPDISSLHKLEILVTNSDKIRVGNLRNLKKMYYSGITSNSGITNKICEEFYLLRNLKELNIHHRFFFENEMNVEEIKNLKKLEKILPNLEINIYIPGRLDITEFYKKIGNDFYLTM